MDWMPTRVPVRPTPALKYIMVKGNGPYIIVTRVVIIVLRGEMDLMDQEGVYVGGGGVEEIGKFRGKGII